MPSDNTVLSHIANGLKHIHCHRLAHRNVHPKNILIHHCTINKEVTIKLADFGLCKELSERDSFSVSQEHQGGECFMAPELLDDPEDGAISELKGYSSSDTFSAGCVFFFFLTRGTNLFGSGTSIVTNIYNGDRVNFKGLHYTNSFISYRAHIILHV
jgi:serine/threonine-protein kinase/endoribonuclease IRE1